MAQQPISSKGCLLLLLGVPASGKSSLIKRFKEYSYSYVDFNSYFIQFDELIPVDQQKCVLNEDKGFKSLRRAIIKCSEMFISCLLNGQNDMHFESECEQEMFQRILNANDNISDSTFVLFIEDNFYLRSMRYEYAKLAKRFKLGFVQLMFDVPVSVCLARNEIRDNRVPQEFIVKMNEVFEKPNTAKNKWEQFTVFISSIDECLQEVMDTIIYAKNNPLCEAIDDSEERLRTKQINSENLTHQLDCFLRQVIRDEIKECDSSDRKRVATFLSLQKSQILQNIQLLPDWFTAAILSKNSFENCRTFVKEILYGNLSQKQSTS